jgi:hypothetical protein
MTLGADGYPIIAYHDHTNSNLKVAHCADRACARVGISAPDTGGSVGWHTDIAIGADRLPIISYYDETNGDLKVLHCGDPSCSAVVD